MFNKTALRKKIVNCCSIPTSPPVYPKHAKISKKHLLLSFCRAIKVGLLNLWEDTVTEKIYIET